MTTTVSVNIADLDPDGPIPANGYLFVSTILADPDGDPMVTSNPFSVRVVDGVAEFVVEPSEAGNAYVINPSGFDGFTQWTVDVPNVPTITLSDLVVDHSVDPDSFVPITSAPTVAERLQDMQDQLDGFVGVPGGGTVTSVNEVEPVDGDITLVPSDIGAQPAGDYATNAGVATAVSSKADAAATTAALALKAPLASPTFTGTVSGVTKAMVGLGSVDNTADTAKPVSTAQQTAIDLKAPIASPTFTGTVGGITKAMVGLGSVDNTSDASKPVSTAQAAADATVLSDAATAAAAASKSADTITDGTTNKAFLATERTKLAGVATGATANSSDATLLARANHTGTQSADTLTDGTTNKAFLATERTKLSGIATSATANDTDANLKARANHTGTQLASTISDFSTAADARVVAGITGKADLASPALTGNPTAPTQAADNNSTRIANTAYVQGELADRVQSTEVLVIDKLTQAAYDALAGSRSATTMYATVG